MQTSKKFSQKYPTRNCKDTLHIGARLVTCGIFNVCEIAVSTSQNTASAHKVRHTSSHISNNCYPETQKALRDLLSDRIKRGTPCENSDRGAKWDCEIESGDVAL